MTFAASADAPAASSSRTWQSHDQHAPRRRGPLGVARPRRDARGGVEVVERPRVDIKRRDPVLCERRRRRLGLRGPVPAARAPVSFVRPRFLVSSEYPRPGRGVPRLHGISTSRPRRSSSPRNIHVPAAASPRLISTGCPRPRRSGVATRLRRIHAADVRVGALFDQKAGAEPILVDDTATRDARA